MTQKVNVIEKIILCLLIFSTIMVMFFGYKLFLEGGNVYEIVSPIYTDKSSYVPGDHVKFYMNVCKYTDYPITVTVSLVDGYVYTLPSIVRDAPIGCRKYWLEGSYLPHNLEEGKYYFRIHIDSEISKFRIFHAEYQTNYIEIVR